MQRIKDPVNIFGGGLPPAIDDDWIKDIEQRSGGGERCSRAPPRKDVVEKRLEAR
ncbi:MAG: hypothetical protein IPL59_08410 [Candidatus Competibacteraceae bacterium]|nr:hypothetical protein [Candidatus Competibacteraceae bacterium]